jgi:hypothetical protein
MIRGLKPFFQSIGPGTATFRISRKLIKLFITYSSIQVITSVSGTVYAGIVQNNIKKKYTLSFRHLSLSTSTTATTVSPYNVTAAIFSTTKYSKECLSCAVLQGIYKKTTGYRKTSNTSPRLVLEQLRDTPGLYKRPGLY